MKKLAMAILVVTAILQPVFAQSGRKITPVPQSTPGAAAIRDEEPQYSESKAPPERRTRTQLGFPRSAQDADTAKNEKGSPNLATADPGEDVVKVETNLITIPVSVFDRNGLYIPGLKQEDFKIFEDGKEQQIAYFGTTDKPFTVILMLDTSPSTAYKMDEIHRAAIAFVDQLKPQDSVMVIEFNGSVKIRTEATNDREQIFKAIKKANFGGGTSLYDAVDIAIMKRINKIEGRKAIVLFTDGVDTTSHKSNYDKTVDEAEESDALIFPIYFNTFLENQARVNSPFPPIFGGGVYSTRGTSEAEYAVGKQYLTDLATYTGGRVFRPESTPGGLTAAFEGIAEELRRQYNIGYVPTDEGKPGQRKRIKVRVSRPNLVIRSRDSYTVGASAVSTPVSAKPDK